MAELHEYTEEQILAEAKLIAFSEEQCLTFINELLVRLDKIFNKKYKLEEI